MIAIIDYGASNLRSVANAFKIIGCEAQITNVPADLEKASAIVLPGVGAFGDGMKMLRELNLITTLNEQVIGYQKPYLGICLGLQFLAKESVEYGIHKGLGWIDGIVQKIVTGEHRFRVPHIGWNEVNIQQDNPLFRNIDATPVFYFVHSYQFVAEGDSVNVITSTCWHGITIKASVQKDNIYAVQFHPEKSQQNGNYVQNRKQE
jgi:glutamine amidotransferase